MKAPPGNPMLRSPLPCSSIGRGPRSAAVCVVVSIALLLFASVGEGIAQEADEPLRLIPVQPNEASDDPPEPDEADTAASDAAPTVEIGEDEAPALSVPGSAESGIEVRRARCHRPGRGRRASAGGRAVPRRCLVGLASIEDRSAAAAPAGRGAISCHAAAGAGVAHLAGRAACGPGRGGRARLVAGRAPDRDGCTRRCSRPSRGGRAARRRGRHRPDQERSLAFPRSTTPPLASAFWARQAPAAAIGAGYAFSVRHTPA